MIENTNLTNPFKNFFTNATLAQMNVFGDTRKAYNDIRTGASMIIVTAPV